MGARRSIGLTLGDALSTARRRSFVGRAAERELARTAFTADESPYAVIWLTGPGGIGKSSLLDMLAQDATASGARIARLDGRHVVPTPLAIEGTVASTLEAGRSDRSDRPDDADDADDARIVLLVDAYERIGQLDDWFRDSFLPGLPGSTVVVIASRHAPSPGWRSDAAWREAVRELTLRNLEPDEGRDYLDRTGIDPSLHDRLLELSHGHPLGLSLLADVVRSGGEPAITPSTPNLVDDLLERFIDVTPSVEHRRALEVCALARVTDEALLRAALERDDAGSVFSWLRSLSFVETVTDGVVPHDLARDVIDTDLRWRDPEEYTRVFRSVRRHVHLRLRTAHGPERRSAAFDLKFLFRNLPSVLSPVDWDTWGSIHPEPAGPGDHPAIIDLVGGAEGATSAAIARRWLASQPGGFHVVRDEDGAPRGVVGVLDLSSADAADLDADPGARAAWENAQHDAPPRSGEIVTQTRFVVDRDAYQGPSPTINATPVVTLLNYLELPHLARDYLTLHDPDTWDPFFAIADFPRVQGADFEVDGRTYGLFCHDFRRTPVDALIELWTERALAQDPTLRPADEATLVLSRPQFAEAVRQGLRDLHRPEALARNPLTRTRLVTDGDGSAGPAGALAGLLSETAAALADDPRGQKLHRAVDRTYVRAAPTQEAAAEILDLPFSTYRRHLTRGVERIVNSLWERELYGRTDEPDGSEQESAWNMST